MINNFWEKVNREKGRNINKVIFNNNFIYNPFVVSLRCKELYDTFADACNEVLSGRVPIPKKNLNDIFFVETISDDGSSTTASTPSVVVQKQSV